MANTYTRSTARRAPARALHPFAYLSLPALAALTAMVSHLGVPLDREVLKIAVTPELVHPTLGGALASGILCVWVVWHLFLWLRLAPGSGPDALPGRPTGVMVAGFAAMLVALPLTSSDVFLYLAQASKAHAFLRGRGYVTPEDVKAIAPDVLRHRVIVTYEAEAEELDSEAIIKQIFDAVDVP